VLLKKHNYNDDFIRGVYSGHFPPPGGGGKKEVPFGVWGRK